MKTLWIAVACLQSGCATGPHPPPQPPPEPRSWSIRELPVRGGLFDRADFDRDGRLSLEESERAVPRIRLAFSAADTNRDGFLTYKELRIYAGVSRWESLEDRL